MGKYILKRVLIFIPTLLAISLITFIISVNAPGDPIEQMLNMNGGGDGQVIDKLASEKAYRAARHQFGFDLPLFYFSITNATCPDTLYRIQDENHRNTLERLSFDNGHWQAVSVYYQTLRGYDLELLRMPRSKENADPVNLARTHIMTLYDSPDDIRIQSQLKELEQLQENPELSNTKSSFMMLRKSYFTLIENKNPWRHYIPVIYWYGLENQYHRWFSHFICGDFGISYQNQRPVSSVLKDAWPWTAGISLLSVLLAYLISIPLGVRSVINKGKRSERVTTTALFALYSLPTFWIATLCVIFLCGGDWLNLFPGPGSEPVAADASVAYKILHTAYRLFLPLVCWTYGSLAFISRQMRGGLLKEINQDYIRTAKAKGLDERSIIWKHAFRNSLLPVITLFASVFPLAISGSVVLEHIFNIPGMGQLSYEALFSKNYPVLFAVMMISAFLTLFGNLIADILYAYADPRISFSSEKPQP